MRFIRQAVTAPNYDERCALLSPILYLGRSVDLFLCHQLKAVTGDDDRFVCDIEEAELNSVLTKPAYDDQDNGPFQAWKWAYDRYPASMVCYGPDQKEIREAGYIFLDLEMIINHTLFSEPFQSPEAPEMTTEECEAMDIQRREEVRSFEIREDLYRRGGRGWWSEGDESKIAWPHGRLTDEDLEKRRREREKGP